MISHVFILVNRGGYCPRPRSMSLVVRAFSGRWQVAGGPQNQLLFPIL